VTVSYHLESLDVDETAAYVNHRLRRAAIGAALEFSRAVTDLIHQHSGGVPRKINVIADAILLFGYGEERRVIDVNLTKEVLEELVTIGVLSGRPVPRVSAPDQIAAPVPVPAPVPVHAPAVPVQAAPEAAVAMPPATAKSALLDREIHAREARLAEREKRVAEQQRVLMEGYRLLRDVSDKPAAAQPAGATRPAWPPAKVGPDATPAPAAASAVPRTSHAVQPHPYHRVFRDPSPQPEGFWTRLRRGLFGPGKPIVEDWRF
jgi:hypothetical protein